MFCRHVFGNISGGFRGISRFFGNFAGFRGNTRISRVRDRAKYQKPCINGNIVIIEYLKKLRWLDWTLFLSTHLPFNSIIRLTFIVNLSVLYTHGYSDCFFYLCSDYGKHLEDALSTVEPKVNIDHGVK